MITPLGIVLSIGIGVFGTASLAFSLWAGKQQRHLDEYKGRDL